MFQRDLIVKQYRVQILQFIQIVLISQDKMKMLLLTVSALTLVMQAKAHYQNVDRCISDEDCSGDDICRLPSYYRSYGNRYYSNYYLPGECVECISDNDCDLTNRLCSPHRNVCYCKDSNCPANTVCSYADQYINSNGQAQYNFYLDADARCSIQCRIDSHCTAVGLEVCDMVNNVCVECTENADCADIGLVCNIAKKQCVQCTKNDDCDASQVCNLGSMTCECDQTNCVTVLGAGNGKCTESADVQDTCVKFCDATAVGDYDYTGTDSCAVGEICLNDGIDNICRSNLIQCADDDGSNRESSRCPTGMSCAKAGEDNSIYCAPLCDASTDFCLGYECPVDFPFSLGGSPCVRNIDNNADICSCIKP